MLYIKFMKIKFDRQRTQKVQKDKEKFFKRIGRKCRFV